MSMKMLVNDDCLEVLKGFPKNSFDLIVTDPPYGISFMGKDWDKALPSKEVWQQCYRVLKEGKLAFIMCSPRQDVLSRMIIALEDSGFRTNYTSIYWTYASGFPKAKNNRDGSYVGFQPKPAVEIILIVSKGKTLTWLDDCRIPYSSDKDVYFGHHNATTEMFSNSPIKNNVYMDGWKRQPNIENQKGRFPANLLVSDDVLNDGSNRKSGWKDTDIPDKVDTVVPFGRRESTGQHYNDSGSYSRYFDLDKWYSSCNSSLPQREICDTFPFIITPKASKSERNKGLIAPKKLVPIVADDIRTPSARHTKFPQVRRHYPEPQKVNDGRNTPIDNPFQRGETLRYNTHPTVKPLKLLSYLITLGSREGDLVLDPFVGSGTSYIAALQLHRKCIGIEINTEYYKIAEARVKPLLEQTKLVP